MSVTKEELTDEEVRDGEVLKEKLQKKHRKTAKKLGTLEDSQDFGSSKEIKIRKPRRTRKEKADEGSSKSPEATINEDSQQADVTDAPDSASEKREDAGEEIPSVDAGGNTAEPADESAPKQSRHKAALQKKLQSKLEKVKESKKAEESEAAASTSGATKRLRSLRGQSMVTRFETAEEIERGEQIEQTLRARSRFREAIREAKTKHKIPSEQECYDFFTKTWDDPVEEEELETEVAAVEGGTQEKPVNTNATLFDLDSITSIKPAEYVPNRKRIEDEESRYFIPSMWPAEDEKKLAEGKEKRFLEQEGLYVGEKPLVSLRNVNRMEQRVLRENDRPERWFGENGHLIMCPDPLKYFPTKPIIYAQEDLAPELQTFYVKASTTENDHRYIDGRVSEASVGKYQMTIEIPDITFSHHPLFNRENVLAARLTQYCDEYSLKLDKNLSQHYSDKLRALKSAIDKVQSMIQLALADHSSHSEIQVQQMHSRLLEYKRELKETRKLRDAEDERMRETLKLISKTWKQIKSLRQQTGYTSTNLKLQLQKEESNRELDLVRWKEDIEAEVEEARMLYQTEHQSALAKYKMEMEEWKKTETRMRKLQERKNQRLKKSKKPIEDEEAMLGDTQGTGMTSEDLNLPPQPKAPEEFNEDQVRGKISDKYLKIRRKPGEPKITPLLTKAAVITPAGQCPGEERDRRNAIKSSKYVVKVLYNGKEVSQSGPKSLSDNFSVQMQQMINVVIVQWPESLVIQLLEQGAFSGTVVCELKLPIPDAAVNTSNVSLEPRLFTSQQVVTPSNSGVGSGREVLLVEDEKITPLTEGTVNCSIAWALGPDGTPLVPIETKKTQSTMQAMKLADPISAISSAGYLDMPRLVEWVNQNRPDPNDPANSTTLHHVKMYTDGGVGQTEKPEYFRLEQLQEEFDFCTDEDLNSNRRFRLLEYRSQEVPEFRNYRMVPLFEKELRPDIFDEYERKMREEEDELMGKSGRVPTHRVEEEMDEHRVLVNKIRKRVYENVLVRFIQAKHQFEVSDIVHEETVPDTAMLGEAVKKFFEPRRPLRPERRERKAVTAPNLTSTDVKILVNVISATHLPVRKEIKTLSEDFTYLRPFVEVSFRDARRSTTAAASYSPTWNEEVSIPFTAPNNDYSPSNLQTIDDILYFNVFDQVQVDLVEDDRDRSTVVHHRLERRWLGSIKIPFSTIYFNSKIEGVFRINAPPVMLGYRSSRELERKTTGLPEILNQEEQAALEKEGSFLSLFATIEPPLAPAEPIKEQFESREDPALIRYAQDWQSSLEKSFPKRSFVSVVVDIQGQSVFVSRYVKKIAPPQELLAGEGDFSKFERVARFVANIPFVSDNLAFPGVCDIWSTCDQFMTMLAGDEEEHAVLLCNYFLHMGLHTYLLMGRAIPEGDTAYVLAFEDEEPKIWNPFTGVSYKVSDPFCPLLSVGCLIDGSNVYANVQAYDEPYRVDFDVKNSSKWKPFFSSKFPYPSAGLASVQPAALEYEETSEDKRLEIQERIEKKIRDKLMEWRPRYVTRWNRHCQIKFRELLPKLETSRTSSNNQKHQEYLKTLLDQHQVCGFPLNMPLTTMQALLDEVHSTGVHLTPGSDIEFALAVYLHAYPNSVFSVWVYVACLSRKTSSNKPSSSS